MLPRDLDILRPSPSRVKPWLNTPLYGAQPLTAVLVISEELNQPRYWSEPSRYRSAGNCSASRWPRTPAWDEPESNHTSIMSFSLRNWLWPHLGQTEPSGRSSDSSRINQALEPSLAKISATWLMVSSSTWECPQDLQ
ncbi:hypothetical protein D3C75_1076220 [compost metagenome]